MGFPSSPSEIARAYEAYVDRCHDAYYGDDGPECPECDAFMDVKGDKWEGSATCPECDHSYWWNNIPD